MPLLLALVVIMVVSFCAYYFYKPAYIAAAEAKLTAVDGRRFDWSGHSEGETVRIQPSWSASTHGVAYPPFERYSLTIGINEAAARLGRAPVLPTLLPEGMNYADVYVGPTVDICFSYSEAQDPRLSDIVIEISRATHVPSLEERRDMVSRLPRIQLIQVGDMWVEFLQAYDASQQTTWTHAQFYDGNLDYWMSFRSPLATQDAITIIRSMEIPH